MATDRGTWAGPRGGTTGTGSRASLLRGDVPERRVRSSAGGGDRTGTSNGGRRAILAEPWGRKHRPRTRIGLRRAVFALMATLVAALAFPTAAAFRDQGGEQGL
ncbi:hypothetical protein [Halomicrobium urmianum]|uniref:hypothetical protein n=1 Tax=Halomicrobium urmianum TaxID=1586233 RepID=UPI001CD96285|nr:hypothetical protein [Halomicrobium urmianum]